MQNVNETVLATYFDVANHAFRQGQMLIAEKMYEAIVSQPDVGKVSLVAALYGLASTARVGGRPEESARLLRRAFAILCRSDHLPADDMRRVACLLADCYLDSEQVARALPVLKMAVRRISRSGEGSQAILSPLLNRIALIYGKVRRSAS